MRDGRVPVKELRGLLVPIFLIYAEEDGGCRLERLNPRCLTKDGWPLGCTGDIVAWWEVTHA